MDVDDDETIIKPKDSVDRLLTIDNLRNVIKQLFTNISVVETTVKKGAKSSSNIYVNKKYEGRRATVLIWDDEN